jgi:uncharacterized membrane protein
MRMAFDHRLQLLLDDERYRKVSQLAEQRGVSVAAVIREAIDRSLRLPDDRRRKAADLLLAAEPMPVPAVDDLRRELDDLRCRRG